MGWLGLFSFMSIFGTGLPKLIDASANTVLLDYVNVLQDAPEENNILHENEIGGNRAAVVRPHNWVFEISMHIYKQASPETYFQTIYALRGTEVTLYRHRDGQPFMDSAAANVAFKVMRVQHYYVGDYYKNNKDAAIMEFRSLAPVDFSQFAGALLSDEGLPILSDTGEAILLD